MAIVFRLGCRVEEWLAAGGRVEVPRPEACPRCGRGGLTFDGWSPPRDTRWGPVVLRRVECKACRHWPCLLPDVLVWGRLDLATVIGWALERHADGWGHQRVASQAARLWPGREAPAATVRGWLRAFRRAAAVVAARLWKVASEPAVRGPPHGDAVAVAVAAAAAAAAMTMLTQEPHDPWRLAVRVTGGRLLG